MDSCINRPDACDPGCRGLFVDGDDQARICRCDECDRFVCDEDALIHAFTCEPCREAMVVMLNDSRIYFDRCRMITDARNRAGDARAAWYEENAEATKFYGAPCFTINVYTYKRLPPEVWGIACVDGTSVRLVPHGSAPC